ncbi:MAG: nucleotide-binding protein [Acidobacteriota bacterium]|nr:nucleotide-binding protein [Acidobacteriota bacterium]
MARTGIKIYVVHGHGCSFVEPVVKYLRSLGLYPILLHDASRTDRSLVERFENFGSKAYALFLVSEEAGVATQVSKGASSKGTVRRPDPQLIFQLGYLVGKLGRRFVSVIHEEDLDVPAELSSLLAIPLDQIGMWKYGLIRDLEAAGFDLEGKTGGVADKTRNEESETPRQGKGSLAAL